ncbi:hypothetical protein GW17_00013701 [Ensete ventricosum]|nr:hypothetical protein GW17_00013701 [Ensete ventricosum]
MGLQWAAVKIPTLPMQLPFFISCPWCNLSSFRLVYNGNLMFPRKNYFLLWMVESMNADRLKSQSSIHGEHRPVWTSSDKVMRRSHAPYQHIQRSPHRHTEHSSSSQFHVHLVGNYFSTEWIHASFRKSLALFIQLTVKFPIVIIFLLNSPLCRSCQCYHLSPSYPNHCLVRLALLFDTILCIPWLGLAS